jgi:hypothetical protein
MRLLRGRWLEIGCLVAGLGILAVTVWRIGLGDLTRDLRTLGWGLVVILLVESVNVVLNTWGWMLAFPSGERTVGHGRLLAVRLAGDGVNYLTPSATVGGEILRVRLLGATVPQGLRWASVSVQARPDRGPGRLHIVVGLALILPGWPGRRPGSRGSAEAVPPCWCRSPSRCSGAGSGRRWPA